MRFVVRSFVFCLYIAWFAFQCLVCLCVFVFVFLLFYVCCNCVVCLCVKFVIARFALFFVCSFPQFPHGPARPRPRRVP